MLSRQRDDTASPPIRGLFKPDFSSRALDDKSGDSQPKAHPCVRGSASVCARTLEGKVTRSADSIATATRTMDTEVDVPNADGSLVPGMYAEVKLHLAARPNVLSVPLDAVDGLGTSVQQAYVVRDGIVHLTPVKVGLQTATRLEILSGLSTGDKVIVGRHTGLSDGQRVDAQPAAYESQN
jgi:RND family efflux transporter MFP subunit